MAVEYLTDGGADRLAAATPVHGEAFKTDPMIQYFVHTMPASKRDDYIPELLAALLKAAALTGGSSWDEAWTEAPARPTPDAPPACSAVWLAPGCTVDDPRHYWAAGFFGMVWNIGLGGLFRMSFGFQARSDRIKRRALRNPDGSRIKRYYYLFFIATAADQRGKGLGGALIRRFQTRAAAEGLPIWLESTTDANHRLYARCGFQDVGSWVVGKGSVDRNGATHKGGDGVYIRAMLWRPESAKAESAAETAAAANGTVTEEAVKEERVQERSVKEEGVKDGTGREAALAA